MSPQASGQEPEDREIGPLVRMPPAHLVDGLTDDGFRQA